VTGFDAASVAAALEQVRARITAAGGGAEVSILPVTKGFGPEAVGAAIAAGCTAIGENYAQELVAKRDAVEPVEVRFIGQLQTNKVRLIADIVDVYETVDRPKLAREIAKRAPGTAVLVQVDTSAETGKGGCPLEQVDELVNLSSELGLDVRGLMTVGPTEGGPDAARSGFRQVRNVVDRLGLIECSMGMTADLEVAVEEGSTQVRVGTALFGPRPVHTWREQER
jgi:hypothetical protein